MIECPAADLIVLDAFYDAAASYVGADRNRVANMQAAPDAAARIEIAIKLAYAHGALAGLRRREAK